MKYRHRFLPTARKQLRLLPRQDAMDILYALTPLGDDPYRSDADIVKLRGFDNLWRLKVGNYRVAFQVRETELLILVVRLEHRREIYQRLRNWHES